MDARVGLRPRRTAVRVAPFVDVVLDLADRVEAQVEARSQAGREGGAQIALDIDVLREVAFQQPHVSARHDRQQGAIVAKADRERRCAGAGAADRAVRQHHRGWDTGALAERIDHALNDEGRAHQAGRAGFAADCDRRAGLEQVCILSPRLGVAGQSMGDRALALALAQQPIRWRASALRR